MRAIIESSSIPAYIDPLIDEVIRSREIDPEHDPNPFGYFSHGSMFAPITEWVQNTPDDSLMKAAPQAFYVDAGSEPLCLVLTSRNQKEIEDSYRRSFGGTSMIDQVMLLNQVEEVLISASNVTLAKLNFADLISNPVGSFTMLAELGWPIDPEIAAATIQPELKRF
jgi:hypothetical protein